MEKIIVVEDSQTLQNIIKFNLVKKNFVVITAGNGKEGLDLINKEKPDLIITDIMMPIMDGITMIKEIKQTETIKNIPIIILSAKNTTQDKLKGFSFGVMKYLTKPFEFPDLWKAIEETKESKGSFKVSLQDKNKMIFDIKNDLNFIDEATNLINDLTNENVLAINEPEQIKTIFTKFHETFYSKTKKNSDIWIKIGFFFSKEKLIIKIAWDKPNLFSSLEKNFGFIKKYSTSVMFDDTHNSILINIVLKTIDDLI